MKEKINGDSDIKKHITEFSSLISEFYNLERELDKNSDKSSFNYWISSLSTTFFTL